MVEDEYVNIQEAARRCGVSGKTIQRAIQAGKLPAQYPKPNQCKIAISALKTFRPGQVSGQAPNPAALESRIAALEHRLSEMELLEGVSVRSLRERTEPEARACADWPRA